MVMAGFEVPLKNLEVEVKYDNNIYGKCGGDHSSSLQIDDAVEMIP